MIRTAIAVAAATAAAASAQSFDDRDDFELAAGAQGIDLALEGFEGLPLDGSTASQDEIVVDDFALSGVNEGFTFLPPLAVQGPTSTGSFATEGTQHVNVGSLFSTGNPNNVVLTFAFNSSQNAFGLDFTGLDNFGSNGGTDVLLFTSSGESFTILEGTLSGPTDLFFGFVSAAAFDEVTIFVSAGDSFGIDAVAYGVVPAPGAFAALGLGGLAAARRRR